MKIRLPRLAPTHPLAHFLKSFATGYRRGRALILGPEGEPQEAPPDDDRTNRPGRRKREWREPRRFRRYRNPPSNARVTQFGHLRPVAGMSALLPARGDDPSADAETRRWLILRGRPFQPASPGEEDDEN